MAFEKPTYSKKKNYQRINLSELLGVNLKGKKNLKLAMGQAIMDVMLERTASGKDIRGNDFKKYSPEYARSRDFRAAGKSSTVDMELTGSMLGDIDIKSTGDGIELFIDGKTSNLKAFNHNTGDTLPKRQFFGVQKKEIVNALKEDFADDIKALKEKQKLKETERTTTAADLLAQFQAAEKSDRDKFIESFIQFGEENGEG